MNKKMIGKMLGKISTRRFMAKLEILFKNQIILKHKSFFSMSKQFGTK